MSWVKEAKSQLHREGICRVRPIGGSMKGAIESGQLVTMVKVRAEELQVGDAVFIKWKGNYILHLVKEINPFDVSFFDKDFSDPEVQEFARNISLMKGGVWINHNWKRNLLANAIEVRAQIEKYLAGE